VTDSTRWWRLALLSGVVILAFDIAASSTSRATGISYDRFAYGSFLIQAAAGFIARRAGFPFGRATVLGTWVAAVEATLGWAVSWWIGPGRPTESLTVVGLAGVALFVIVTGTALGALGAWIGGQGRSSMAGEV